MKKMVQSDFGRLVCAVGILLLIWGLFLAFTPSRRSSWENEAAEDAKDSQEYHRLATTEKLAHARTQAWIDWKIKKCQAKNPQLKWLKADGVGDPVCAEAPSTPQVPAK